MKTEHYRMYTVKTDPAMKCRLKMSFSLDKSYVVYDKINNVDENLSYDGFKIFIHYSNNSYFRNLDDLKHTQSLLLTVLGVISFFTNSAVYINLETYFHSLKIDSFPIKSRKNTLLIDDKDYTQDLNSLLAQIKDQHSLLPSILDKLRRVQLKTQISADAFMDFDDAFLCMVQALEILVSKFEGKIEDNFKRQLNAFLTSFFTTSLFDPESTMGDIKASEREITKFLYKGKVGLSTKLKFVLNENGLLDDTISYFIDNIIKSRNLIAHGNKFDESSLFIYSQFFGASDYTLRDLTTLEDLTLCLISTHFGLNIWADKINNVKSHIPLSYTTFRKILKHELGIEEIYGNSLDSNKTYNKQMWLSVMFYYVKIKKIRKKIEKVFKKPFLNTEFDSNYAPDIANLSLPLSEAYDPEIRDKARDNIKRAIDLDRKIFCTYYFATEVKPSDLKYKWFEQYICSI